MAAMVETLPQQSGPVTMLQSRSSAGQPGQQRGRPGSTGYRPAKAPIQPYAFTSTPSLGPAAQRPHEQATYLRTTPSSVTNMTPNHESPSVGRTQPFASVSMTNLTQTGPQILSIQSSRDDSILPSKPPSSPSRPRHQSGHMAGSPAQGTPTSKSTPDRYRRAGSRLYDAPITSQGLTMPSGSGMATVGHIYMAQPPVTIDRNKSGMRPNSFHATTATSVAVDDMHLYRQRVPEEARRLRRRSMHTLESVDYPIPLNLQEPFGRKQKSHDVSRIQCGTEKYQAMLQRNDVGQKLQKPSPLSSRSATANAILASSGLSNTRDSTARHSRHSSTDSAHSSRSNSNAASNHNSRPSSSDSARPVTPRNSSTDVSKRVLSPSPLSKPVTMEPTSSPNGPAKCPTAAHPNQPPSSQSNKTHGAESLAAQQLAALNEKGKKSKSKTSRLRRAFSFGSAAELKNAAAQNGVDRAPTKLHKERDPNDMLDEEQAKIAKKQEEGGIGNNIYGAKIFASSTDNISISSTASSASIMIRKMGSGMKRGTRSLIGLFRPKTVAGVPASDFSTPEAPAATLSMVTVEAERERVNVNTDLQSQADGGTAFPYLERNSMDANKTPRDSSERVGSSGTDNSVSRKSIVVGEKERAEVLAAVKKGILKHSGSNSPSPRPQENRIPCELPNVPFISDSPNSSAPSTPNSEAQGHKRSESVAIRNEDYFITALRLRENTKSAPITPNSTVKRSATFSPRIVFHDTWPSQEYDRRGEIATCNRLTPLLAQQIKEELNNFKMEMEVHEASKIYTHFF